MKLNDPIFDNTLFVLENEDWKRVRNILTPTMTSAKLKQMIPLMANCCELLIQNIAHITEEEREVNLQRIFSAFTIDTITKCVFGTSIDSLNNENNPLVSKAKTLLEPSYWKAFLIVVCPGLMKLFSTSLFNPDTIKFYRNFVEQVMEQRTGDRFEDVLQLLLDAKNSAEERNNNTESDTANNNSSSSTSPNRRNDKNTKGLSSDELMSQCVTFFLAGHDAIVTLLTNVMYHLAMYQEHQQRVLEEIEAAMGRHNGEVSYDTLSELKFLDAVINECLRLCPTIVRNERSVAKDCILPHTNIRLLKDSLISIPVYAMQRDPEWFPEPEEFKPERFYGPADAIPQYVTTPFGIGPRMCVGFRFVMMQVKLCVARLLLRFDVHPTFDTPATLEVIEVRNVLKIKDINLHFMEKNSWILL